MISVVAIAAALLLIQASQIREHARTISTLSDRLVKIEEAASTADWSRRTPRGDDQTILDQQRQLIGLEKQYSDLANEQRNQRRTIESLQANIAAKRGIGSERGTNG